MKKPLGLFRKPLSYLLINTTHLNIAILSVLVFFLLPGCVEKKTTLKPEKKMTLEEAKRVTVSMSGKTFSPPPRRINDILAVLDEPGQMDRSFIKKFKTKADMSNQSRHVRPRYKRRSKTGFFLP